MSKILFILDRAHGINVSGKSSPDGSFEEWEYSQKVVDELSYEMDKLDIPNAFNVTGQEEPGLDERIKEANRLSEGVEIPILLSFHNNAGGGTGNELFIRKKPRKEDILIGNTFAKTLINDFPEIEWRQEIPEKLYKEAYFRVLVGSKKERPRYFGALIEFLFMDNPKDLELLKDERIFYKYIDSLLFASVQVCNHFGYGNFKIV